VYGALLAGCRSFHGGTAGFARDLSDTAARLFPACGGAFLGAASENAAFEAVRAEAATGDRTMAAVSGAALWQLLAEAERAQLPVVALHVRAEALPSEAVPAGGEPAFVLAPASPQELADLTCLAFDLAHRHRRPAVVLVDPFLGQMVEPVSLPCVTCDRAHRAPCGVSSPELISLGEPVGREALWEEGGTQDADVLLVSWGSAARTLPRAMALARAQGLRAGFLRPVSLAPFPSARLAQLTNTVRSVVLLESVPSPWSDAVRTAAGGRAPVTVLRGASGTGLPSAEETVRALRAGMARAPRQTA
jgi:pyruvate/2-oxoacid:ferredoxin oxidoreductase alpha subunit